MLTKRKLSKILPEADFLEAMVGDFIEAVHLIQEDQQSFTKKIGLFIIFLSNLFFICLQNFIASLFPEYELDFTPDEDDMSPGSDCTTIFAKFPEDCFSEIKILRRRMAKRKLPAWKIRKALAQEYLSLLWACYIQIPFEEFFLLPSKDDDTTDE